MFSASAQSGTDTHEHDEQLLQTLVSLTCGTIKENQEAASAKKMEVCSRVELLQDVEAGLSTRTFRDVGYVVIRHEQCLHA